jgi:hypothetical protein
MRPSARQFRCGKPPQIAVALKRRRKPQPDACHENAILGNLRAIPGGLWRVIQARARSATTVTGEVAGGQRSGRTVAWPSPPVALQSVAMEPSGLTDGSAVFSHKAAVQLTRGGLAKRHSTSVKARARPIAATAGERGFDGAGAQKAVGPEGPAGRALDGSGTRIRSADRCGRPRLRTSRRARCRAPVCCRG